MGRTMTSGRPDRSPTRLPAWMTGPLARVYGREVGRRNRRWDRGEGVTRLDRPVISVGNLSAGGTGKTPMVRWVVGALQETGHRPAVAMRGYKAEPGHPSDEEREHREALPGVPVVARPDRGAGLRALFASPEGSTVDCVVLDDGFQHRRLARDLDIVLVDASRPPDRDALLPLGYLREPLASLRRAHACVLTHAELVTPGAVARLVGVVREHLPEPAPVAVADHRWAVVRRVGTPDVALDPAWLAGRRVVAVCAIGHPEAFLRGLERAGARTVSSLCLPDHDPFAASTVRRLNSLIGSVRPEAVVMTAKDLTKLGPWSRSSPTPVVIPELGMGWRAGEDALRGLLGTVFAPWSS
jgi:tetraacyldisaccharide 4'-kinase